MATIPTISHGSYLNTPRRSYLSMASFQNDFFSYTVTENKLTQVTTGTLSPVTTNASLTPPGRLLRENGKKLYPGGANPGVNTYMVGVYDPVSFLNGYIDPNSYTFTLANTDKPYDVYEAVAGTLGTNPNSGATYPNDLAPPVLTNGDIIAKGMVSTIGGITTNSNIFALGNIQATSYIATNSYLSSGTACFVGTSLTAQQNIQNGGFVSTSRLYLKDAGDPASTVGNATLSGGSVTVSTTGVSSTSKIFLTYTGLNNPGVLRVSAITPGVSFTITSTSGTDAGTVNWLIIN